MTFDKQSNARRTAVESKSNHSCMATKLIGPKRAEIDDHGWPWSVLRKVMNGMAPRYLGPFVRVADLPGRRALHSAVTNRLTVYQLLNCLRSAAERFLFPVLKRGTNYRKKSPLRHLYLPSKRHLKTFLFRKSFPDIIDD